ncbi:hypothetical protein BDV19DRAFT_367553 [Aspergillus venezuelensis]
MISAYDNPPPIEDVRLPKAPARNLDLGAATMEMATADDRSRSFPQFSGPPPPVSAHRIPPPEVSHGLPGPAMYDQSWRQPYPPSFDANHTEPRRVSNGPPPPVTAHHYPPMQSRELPQLPVDGPYGRTASLPTPPGPHAPSEGPPPPPAAHANYHPMNGAPHDSSPLSAPPEFPRHRMPYPPADQAPLTNGNPPAVNNEYPTTIPPTVSHTPAPYDASYYPQHMRQRKATRAQQACDQCRTRKAKCDEGRPACSHCRENNLQCIYKEPPPHKQDRSTREIMDKLIEMQDLLMSSFRNLEKLHVGHDQTLDRIELKFQDPQYATTKEVQPPQYPVMKPDGSDLAQIPESKGHIGMSAEKAKPDHDPTVYTKGLLQTGEDGELSIPVEHTTAAHKLLNWPSISSLLHNYDKDYVMKYEETRGPIAFTGRGEEKEDEDMNGTHDPSNPSPPGSWDSNTKFNEALPETRGIDEYGRMSVDGQLVRRYFYSYIEHLHKLHPFLDIQELEQKIDVFIGLYCPQPGLSVRSSMEASRSAKRKRSGEMLLSQRYDQRSPTEGPMDSPRPVQKKLGNAIILLLLALGRICEVRHEPIRGPCSDQVIDYRREPIPGVANLKSQSDLMSWPIDDKFVTPPDRPDLDNRDTVPGLAYYAYAASILSEKHAVTNLAYVQATLLAGLYMGQLARPFQNHGWIELSCHACQNLIRPGRYEALEDGYEQDSIHFAFWTGLQLESDLLAELDLPASGITRSEGRIPLPKGKWTLKLPNSISDPNTIMMFFYSAQTHLRKILNRVHRDLYKVEKQGQDRWSSSVQETLSMNLDLWRSALPTEMRWNDDDPPSDDINVARMRAKYWGARYIIHRPLLYHALHYAGPDNFPVDSPIAYTEYGPVPQQASPQAPNMARASSDLSYSQGANGSRKAHRDLPMKLRRACLVCVQSAIKSTEAFDGIKGRPVVTNIFGTAHAQFGNMLVLSAVYMSHLSELIKREELERLLRRTIHFLLQYRNISPVLRTDAKILADIYMKIFGESPTAPMGV